LQEHYVEYNVQPVCNVNRICTHLNINTEMSGDRYGFYKDGWSKEFRSLSWTRIDLNIVFLWRNIRCLILRK